MPMSFLPLTRQMIFAMAAVWLMTLALLLALDLRIFMLAANLPDWVGVLSAFITDLGHGSWMAITTLSLAMAGAFVASSAPRAAWRQHGRLILRIAVVFFVILLLSGIAVQLLKHVIGRARPSMVDLVGAYAFVPLQPGTAFNSLPSGHSSTIAALMILVSWLLPGTWPLWLGTAILVGVSRVTTLQHYAADVFAGWTLGIIVASVALSLVLSHRVLPARTDRRWRALGGRLRQSIRRAALDTTPLRRKDLALAARLMLAAIAALIVFQAMPQIDRWIAWLFFVPGQGFVLAEAVAVTVLDATYRLAVTLAFVIALAMWALAVRLGECVKIPAQLWGFALAALILGPALLHHGMLSHLWGPSPSMTPWPPQALGCEVTLHCDIRIGAGGGIVILAITVLAMFWPKLSANRPALWALGLFVAIGSGLQIVTGRQFLSDILIAASLMALVALVLFHWLRMRAARVLLTAENLRHDLELMLGYIQGPLWADLWLLGTGMMILVRAMAEAFRAMRKPPGGWSALSLRAVVQSFTAPILSRAQKPLLPLFAAAWRRGPQTRS